MVLHLIDVPCFYLVNGDTRKLFHNSNSIFTLRVRYFFDNVRIVRVRYTGR